GFQQIERAGQIGAVALGPAMRLVVPIERYRGVALLDAAVDKDRQQPVEIRRAPEQPPDALDHLFLAERIRRHGGGQGQEARGGWHWHGSPRLPRRGFARNATPSVISSPPAPAAQSPCCEPLSDIRLSSPQPVVAAT